MTIKEFSSKHSSTFFWATIILAILLLISLIKLNNNSRYPSMMRQNRGTQFNRSNTNPNINNNIQRPMMNNGVIQNPTAIPTPIQNITNIKSTTTVNTSVKKQ